MRPPVIASAMTMTMIHQARMRSLRFSTVALVPSGEKRRCRHNPDERRHDEHSGDAVKYCQEMGRQVGHRGNFPVFGASDSKASSALRNWSFGSPSCTAIGLPKVTVQINGTGTTRPLAIRGRGFDPDWNEIDARARLHQDDRAALERQQGDRGSVACALREHDQRGTAIQSGNHRLHRISGARFAIAIDQHGVEDIAADNCLMRDASQYRIR